ncbi:transposase [Clostridium saccharobutylicum]|uniref:transposase n=1 Tax=Clostridium saccharobutylicum TaxID=169679 RepID=UPI001591CA05
MLEEHAVGNYIKKYDDWYSLSFKKSTCEYPNGKIVTILDNVKIHHAKSIQPFLAEMKNRFELMFLPPYSPGLNVIEGFCDWLKSSVVNNVFFKSVVSIRFYI